MSDQGMRLVGSIKPSIDMVYFLPQVAERIGGPRFGFILEAFQNSLVAGATQFVIYSIGRGKMQELIFVDNGKGMGPAGRQAFCDWGKSLHRGNPNVRSKHGYGSKSAMTKFDHMLVVDCSHEEAASGEMYTMDFDWEELIKGYEDKGEGEPINCYAIPRDPSVCGLPEGATSGVCLRLSRRRDGVESYSPETLVKHLARVLDLPPWQAEKIGVCAGPGEAIVPVEFEREEDETCLLPAWNEARHGQLGEVKIHLAVDVRTDGRRQLKIGTVQETICSWRDFVRDIPDDLWDESLEILLSPLVRGHIHFGGLMPFRGGDSLSFTQALYSSPILVELLNFLRLHVVPDVQKRMEGSVKVQDSSEDKSLGDELAKMIQAVGSDRGTPPAPASRKLVVTPSYVELECGHVYDFAVTVHDPAITQVDWDRSGCAGQLTKQRDDGFAVRYKAPSRVEGGFSCYQLVAYDHHHPATRSTAIIDVFARTRLRISPHQITIAPGTRTELCAKGAIDIADAAKNGADIVWRLVNGESLQGCGFAVMQADAECIVATTHGFDVMFEAGTLEGEYQIEAWVANKREQTLATAYIRVACPSPRKPKNPADPYDTSDSGGIWLDGVQYTIQFHRLPDMPAMALLQSPRSAGPSTIIINLAHSAFAPYKGNRMATLQLAFDRFLLAHYVQQGVVDADVVGRFDDTRGKMAKGLNTEASPEPALKP